MALWHDLIPRIHRSGEEEYGGGGDDAATHSKNIDFPTSRETLLEDNGDDDLKNYSLSPGFDFWWTEFEPSSSDESQPHDQSINSSATPLTNSTNAWPWSSQHLIQHNINNTNRSHLQKQKTLWTTSKRKISGNLQGSTSYHSEEDGRIANPSLEGKENLSLAATLGVGSLLLFVNLSVFGAILLRRLKMVRCDRDHSVGDELFSTAKRLDDQINNKIIDLYCERSAHSNDYDESIDTIISSDDTRHQLLLSNHQLNHNLQNKCLRFQLLPMKRDSKSANELSRNYNHHHRQLQISNVRCYKACLNKTSQKIVRQNSENISPHFNLAGKVTQDILMTSLDSTNLLENETRYFGKAGHFETDSDDFLVSFSSVERQSSSPILHSSHNKFSEVKKLYRQVNQSETSPEATSTTISCHAHITRDLGLFDAPKELPFRHQSSNNDRTISSLSELTPTSSFNKSTCDHAKFSIRQNEFHSSPITSV